MRSVIIIQEQDFELQFDCNQFVICIEIHNHPIFMSQLQQSHTQNTHIKSSRAKSCADLNPKDTQTDVNAKPSRHERLIQNLLHKRTQSSKKIFTDETTYSYKPQISNLPPQLYPSSRTQIEVSKQQIFERLIENIKTKRQNFQLIKLQNQDLQFKQNCSFIPKISEASKAMVMAKLKTEGNSQNRQPFARLYKQGLQKKAAEENQYISAKERQLTQQHTFHPYVNPTSKQILNNENRNIEPIFKRVDQILEKKRIQQKLIEEQKQKEIAENSKVRVQNKKTLEILQRNECFNAEKKDVVKRLLDDYFSKKEEKFNSLKMQQKEKIKKQCPFQPKVNNNYLLMNSSTFDHQQDFIDRQKQFEDAVKENISTKANQLAPSFKPEINKLSQLICKDRQHQSLEDKLNRLNYQPLFEKQVQIEELQKSLYKECKFHPQINEISKALQGPLKPHACKCHPQPQKFDFMPNINKKSREMASNRQEQVVNRKKKEEVVNKIKMQRQYNELIECTFQPRIKNLNKQQLKFNQNTADFIPGVKQFVEKRNLIMQRKIEDQKYKEKIFNLEKRYKSKTCTTVQEFKLSHKQYDSRGKKDLIEEAEHKFRKQHPFKPNVESIR